MTISKQSYHELILLDEFIVAALIVSLFALFVYPLYIEGVLNGENFWFCPEEALFIKGLFGSYNYVLHDLLLVALFFLGVLVTLFGLRFYIDRSINSDGGDFFEYKVLFKAVIIGTMAMSFTLLIWFLLDRRYSTFFMFTIFGLLFGTLLTIHIYLTREIHIMNVLKFKEDTLKRAFYLGIAASLLFFAMGVYVFFTGDVSLAQTKIPTIVVGINIMQGISGLIFVALIYRKRAYSGGILLILSSYFTVSVGGGFLIGIGLGILSGILAIISTEPLMK